MSTYQEEINRIMRTARGKSDGDVALLQEAARLADMHADPALGLKVRIRLINAANFSGNHELVLVAFTWCLAQIDRDEQLRLTSEREVLWYYKWVVDSLSEYSQVSRTQIEHSFADMTNRYVRAGYSMGPLHKCRAMASIRLGDLDAHRTARQRWENSPREDISDCLACDTDTRVDFDLEAGNFVAALKTAAPILLGRQRCAEIPCLTAGRLLLPLLKLGDKDLAERLHRGNIRQTLTSRDFLGSIGSHIAYLALTGRIPPALMLFETGLPWFLVTRRTWERMAFVQNSAVLFAIMARVSDDPVKVKVSPDASFYRPDDTYSPSTIAKALSHSHHTFAEDFNTRNGNPYMNQRSERFQQLVADLQARS